MLPLSPKRGRHQGISHIPASLHPPCACPDGNVPTSDCLPMCSDLQVADIIQIPAFLCRQTDLLVAAAKTG